MKNLNEQISRIKSLMLIKEQCGSDLDKCEDDLENAGYVVYNKNEQYSSCENKTNLTNANSILEGSGISANNRDLAKNAKTQECRLLCKSEKEENNEPKFHITFYSDNQFVITALLNSENENKKLLYDGKYKATSSSLTFSSLKYKGIYKSGSLELTSFDIIKSPLVDADGDGNNDPVEVSAADGSSWGIPSGKLASEDYLSRILKKNVLNNTITLPNIVWLLTTNIGLVG
ncbi:MAG: hypothetical protein ACXACC_10420 [Promethearchaeota archaeon]